MKIISLEGQEAAAPPRDARKVWTGRWALSVRFICALQIYLNVPLHAPYYSENRFLKNALPPIDACSALGLASGAWRPAVLSAQPAAPAAPSA